MNVVAVERSVRSDIVERSFLFKPPSMRGCWLLVLLTCFTVLTDDAVEDADGVLGFGGIIGGN